MDYYKTKLNDIYKELKTNEKGISESEAKTRLDEYGKNKIESGKKISPFLIFLSQFNNPVVWVLIGAAIISGILGEIVDLYVILIILMANAVIGFKQEYNAEKAIEALKKMASLKTVVLRDGSQREIDAEDLVPGDVVLLSAGEKIPADCRLFFINNLQVQEAALTGESLPVSKKVIDYSTKLELGDQRNMVFSGTIITEGKGKAIVVGTGMKTEIGKIAKLIDTAEETQTPLQLKMEKLGKLLTYIVLVVSVVIFTIMFLRKETWINSLETAAALAVAAIPEGLAVVVTVSLAIGVKRMIKKNALVRKLPSVETLGSTTVICSDKTGTLTKNEMTVKKIFVDNQVIEVSGSGYEPEGDFSSRPKDLDLLLQIGALNNDARLEKSQNGFKILGDPTEGALIVSAEKAGFNHLSIVEKYPRFEELLFTSERKRMTTFHKIDGENLAYTKGAPDVILDLCDSIILNGKVEKLTKEAKKKILSKNDEFSKKALRVIGFAYKPLKSNFKNKEEAEEGLIFVGLQGMIDPPREEVKDSIFKCKTAGIKVVMITGDYLGTAEAIARELGIEGKAVQGKDIESLNLEKEVDKIGIYARVNPEHKMKIVQALQKKGHVVAMTGDGVNDAPALKASDIGISMGITGTDVAKESSDMILTDDNFTSIVNAVEEGRGVYDNIRKYFAFLISGNIAEILILFFAILVGLPAPLAATQILLINLVTDGLPAIALSADPYEPGALTRKPRKKGEPIYKGLTAFTIYYPFVMTVVSLAVFYWFFKTGSLAKAQTVTFVTIGLFELYQAFACRSIRYSSFKVGLFKNKYLVLAVVSSLVILGIIVFIPSVAALLEMEILTINEFITLTLIASTGYITIEISKLMKKEQTT